MNKLVYDKMAFPTYAFHEYPKWIRLNDGSQVVVENRHAELLTIAEDSTAKTTPSALAQGEEIAKMSKLVLELQFQIAQMTGDSLRTGEGKIAEAAAQKAVPPTVAIQIPVKEPEPKAVKKTPDLTIDELLK